MSRQKLFAHRHPVKAVLISANFASALHDRCLSKRMPYEEGNRCAEHIAPLCGSCAPAAQGRPGRRGVQHGLCPPTATGTYPKPQILNPEDVSVARRCGCCSTRRTWRAAWISTWTCARGSIATGATSPRLKSGPTGPTGPSSGCALGRVPDFHGSRSIG